MTVFCRVGAQLQHLLCERRYIRPEVRFGGLGELVARIRTDVGLASAALDTPMHADLRQHEFLA